MPDRDSPEDFFGTAAQHGLLSKERALELAIQVKAEGIHPARWALSNGTFSAVDIDIVEMLLDSNTAIPGYEILEFLGRGGMGVVFVAKQKALDRPVALKTVRVGQLNIAEGVARFKREAVTIGRLRHPNIVAGYDFGEHNGRLYLAMELVRGDDLQTWIEKRGRLSEATAWGLARQTASGLAHAASAGIVHRDIKPANLLLVEPPEGFSLPHGLRMVKITDFGLAFLGSEVGVDTRLTSFGTAIGTPFYMPPEQFQDAEIDLRGDIYALGATVYHMLAGAPPFASKSLGQVVTRKLANESPRLRDVCPEVSPETESLVLRMMAPTPDRRFESYASLIEAIDRVAVLDHAESSFLTGSYPEIAFANTVEIRSPRSTVDVNGWLSKTIAVRKRGFAIGALVLVAAVGAALALRALPLSSLYRTPTANLIPTNWEADLFNGTNLAGWSFINGEWLVSRDHEGAPVLTGRGAIRRPLPFKGRGEPLRNYRLFVSVDPRQAVAELHFGIGDTDSQRYVAAFRDSLDRIRRRDPENPGPSMFAR